MCIYICLIYKDGVVWNDKAVSMDKLQLAGWNLVRVFNSKSGCMCAKHLFCYEAKQPNLKLKTQPKQVLGYLPMAFAL